VTTRTIKVDYLARVEGEGALVIRFKDKRASSVELNIYEPPRFFEALLRGREALEAPDITSRICGICPIAYMMSACHAIEDALGLVVSPEIRKLRRLIYAGEWVGSHALHLFMLHTPDFVGCDDVIEVAKRHPEFVKDGLLIKKTGNAIVATLGGREIHPINVRVGGFYRAPAARELEPLTKDLERALEAMERQLVWLAGLAVPEFERDYEFVALRHPSDYPFCEGRIVSSAGIDIAVRDYESVFEEYQVPHSTALHSRIRGRGAYLCGPLARLNLNFDRLRPRARAAALAAGLAPPVKNPLKSLLVRAVEIIQALDEALEIVTGYRAPDEAAVPANLRPGVGYGCTEAPRGALYHRYAVDERGIIQDAKIVPPTSQNQWTIEQDLFEIAPELAELPHAIATRRAEQAVRNHDPCISCSTHFLRLRMEQEP
jgi:coenzyme F420-reducing hydrogenase alpha subunit